MTPSKTPSQPTPSPIPLFSSTMPATRAAAKTRGQDRLKRLDRWQAWALFPVAFAGYLFISRPSPVRAVFIYRVALAVAGVATWVVLALKKRSIRREQ